MGVIVCSNYGKMRIIEIHFEQKKIDGGWDSVRIIERFEYKKFELARVYCMNSYRPSLKIFGYKFPRIRLSIKTWEYTAAVQWVFTWTLSIG